MAYAIIRVEKLKTMASVKNRLDHNHRDKEVMNADQNVKNPALLGQPKSSEEAMNLFTQRVSEAVKPRKDSVIGLEYLMTSGPEFFSDKSPEDIQKWAADSLDFIIDTVGKKNVISATLHLDETTPHLQVIVVPAVVKVRRATKTRPQRKELALCAKNFTGGRDRLAKLWTDYHSHMKKRGHDLERGRESSYATRNTTRNYYDVINKYASIEPVIKQLEGKLNKAESELKTVRKDLREDKEELSAVYRELHQAREDKKKAEEEKIKAAEETARINAHNEALKRQELENLEEVKKAKKKEIEEEIEQWKVAERRKFQMALDEEKNNIRKEINDKHKMLKDSTQALKE